MTLAFAVLDRVFGAVPVVPVTVRLNGGSPVAQMTDKMFPLKVAVHPDGRVPAVNATWPLNPLIGVTVIVDVPGVVANVVMAGAESEKSTMWKRIMLVVCDTVPLVPVTVTV